MVFASICEHASTESFLRARAVINFVLRAASHPRTQGLRSPWPAVGKRTTLERSDLKSENIGLAVELRMPCRQKQIWRLKSKYSYRVGEVYSSSIVVEVGKKGVSHKDKHLGILKDYYRWESIKKRDNLAELRTTEPVSNSASLGFIMLINT